MNNFLVTIFVPFRIIVDLNDLPKEQTVNIWKDVEDGKGRINLLVTVSATTRGDTPSNLANWEEDLDKMKDEWTKAYVSKVNIRDLEWV